MKRATARIKSASALKVQTGKPWATSGKRLQSGVRQGRAVLDGQGLEEGTMQGNLVDHCGSIISCSYAQYRKLAAPEKKFIPGRACRTHLETRSTIVAVSASASPRRERDGHREGSLAGAAWILQMWNKNHYLAKLRKPRHTRLIVQSSPMLKYFNTLM